MNLKLLFFPIALVVEAVSVVISGKECGFGNYVFDRKLNDPIGKLTQSRQEALDEDARKRKP